MTYIHVICVTQPSVVPSIKSATPFNCFVVFRRGRRTEDNLFMLERIIEMSRERDERLFVAFVDMEKAYDGVNRRKLLEVMRSYGIHEKLVNVIERVYKDNKVKFELGDVVTKWCVSDSGVRLGCPMSSIVFNLYVRELGECITKCKNGFKTWWKRVVW